MSNVTGRHRGPKRKLRAGYSLQSAVTKMHVMLRLLFIVECGIVCFLCTMRVFKVWASSSLTP